MHLVPDVSSLADKIGNVSSIRFEKFPEVNDELPAVLIKNNTLDIPEGSGRC